MMKALSKFYDSYRYRLESSGKLKSGSMLIACLKMKKNDRFRPLRDSAIDGHKIPQSLLSQLKDQGLVRGGGEVSKFVITGRGIWEVEVSKGLIDEAKLIEFVDSNYFEELFEDAKPLSDKEKVILLSMISARAFSEDSSVDMKRDSEVNAAWLELFKLCASKLREMRSIDTPDGELFPEELKYEDAASHFIRHTDQLPRKTRGIYSASKKRENKYFLDVSKEGEIDQDRLSYLVWLVVGNQLKPEGIEEFNEFCASVAYDHSVRLFEHEKHIFASPRFDEVLRNTIIESIVSKEKWEASG
jgi:hypothetical protein